MSIPITSPQPTQEALTLARIIGEPTEEGFRAYALIIDAYVTKRMAVLQQEHKAALACIAKKDEALKVFQDTVVWGGKYPARAALSITVPNVADEIANLKAQTSELTSALTEAVYYASASAPYREKHMRAHEAVLARCRDGGSKS